MTTTRATGDDERDDDDEQTTTRATGDNKRNDKREDDKGETSMRTSAASVMTTRAMTGPT